MPPESCRLGADLTKGWDDNSLLDDAWPATGPFGSWPAPPEPTMTDQTCPHCGITEAAGA